MVKSVSITKKRRKLLTIENPAIMEILHKKKGAENQRLVGDYGDFLGIETGDYGRYANVLRIPSSGLYLFLWVSVGGVLPNSLKKMRIHFENVLGFLLLSILP